MGWIDTLLHQLDRVFRRLGLVRIERYGLLLTPDDRILSTRHAVLDDGIGGKIVGWRETDFAGMELEKWSSVAKPSRTIQPQPATRRPVLAVSQPRAVGARPVTQVRADGTPPASRVIAPAQPYAVANAPVHAPIAPTEPVEEEDWDWEIARARARAAADVGLAAPTRTARGTAGYEDTLPNSVPANDPPIRATLPRAAPLPRVSKLPRVAKR